MASRHPSSPVVAILICLAACTSGSQPAAPTAPPDAFAPTPSIGDLGPPTTSRAAPPTTAEIERMALHRVDPETLEQLRGFEPIPMSDWMWGQPSPNGGFYLAAVGDDDGANVEMRLVDVANWRVVGTWPLYPEVMTVTDQGTGYVIASGRVHRLRPYEAEPAQVATVPEGFSPWASGPIVDDALAVIGSRYESDQYEHVSLLSIDLDSGIVAEFDLPQVRIGVEPGAEEPWAQSMYVFPAVAWDSQGDRAFVVHADADIVSEVDLHRGVVTAHEVVTVPGQTPAAFLRSAAAGSNGTTLHVASAVRSGSGDDQTWEITTTSVGVVSIDTTNWEVSAQTDEPIHTVTISPDGSRLVGFGDTSVETQSTYSSQSGGLFVLDSSNLSTIGHIDAERAEQTYYGPVSFNSDLGLAYVTVETSSSLINVIELATGEVRIGYETDSYTEMIGSIGAMGITAAP